MSSVGMMPQYSTILFTDVWDNVTDFINDYRNNGIPWRYSYTYTNAQGQTTTAYSPTLNDDNISTLFYLLYARYGNNPIANRDVTQFKYKIFSIIFQYGPTWQKNLAIQANVRNLTEADIRAGSFAMYNQALNPSTAPSTASDTELNYINGQNTTRYKKSKLEGYAILTELLKADVTEDFLKKFNICFKRFVSSERPLIYVTDNEEDEE